MKPVGVVIVEIPEGANATVTRSLVQDGAAAVPAGRLLAVTYYLPHGWVATVPTESIVVETVLGEPARRGSDDDWEFFANLGVRLCSVRPSSREVLGEMGVVLLRRSGPKAYARRPSASPELLAASELPALHAVFTRDVANNIWHLPVAAHVSRLRRRLSALLAWTDEVTLVVTPDGSSRRSILALDLDSDLVGVPTKTSYSWDEPPGPEPVQRSMFDV